MRNVLFLLTMGIVLLTSAVLAFPFAMNECQLSHSQSAIDACFERNHREIEIYGLTASAFLISAILLHFRKSGWAFVALLGVTAAPFAAIIILFPN